VNENEAWDSVFGKDVGTSPEDVAVGAQIGTSVFEGTEGITEEDRMEASGVSALYLTSLLMGRPPESSMNWSASLMGRLLFNLSLVARCLASNGALTELSPEEGTDT